MRRQGAGMTLIELVIVIVALSGGVALLGRAFIEPARSVIDNENIQITWQVTQACLEHTLGSVRKPGSFGAVVIGSDPCSALPANGTTRTATVSDYTSGAEPCPTGGWSCRLVSVQAGRGGYTASASYVFINY